MPSRVHSVKSIRATSSGVTHRAHASRTGPSKGERETGTARFDVLAPGQADELLERGGVGTAPRERGDLPFDGEVPTVLLAERVHDLRMKASVRRPVRDSSETRPPTLTHRRQRHAVQDPLEQPLLTGEVPPGG